jgi:hypothetical protein
VSQVLRLPDAKDAELRPCAIASRTSSATSNAATLLEILNHPNPDRYDQRMCVRGEDYVYVVPFAEDDRTVLCTTLSGFESLPPSYPPALARNSGELRRDGSLTR